MVSWRSNPRLRSIPPPPSPNLGASLGIFAHTCPESGGESMSAGGMMLCYAPAVRLSDGLILLLFSAVVARRGEGR